MTADTTTPKNLTDTKLYEDTKGKIMLENMRNPSEIELELVADTYADYYKWRNWRSGEIIQFQNRNLEDFLKVSRELFWNAFKTPSEDLAELGLEFSIGFLRKETLDYLGRLTQLGLTMSFTGDNLDAYGIKVLDALYKKWRFHSNDKVEKFWDLLYGTVNGTLCKYIGYNDAMATRRFLRAYNKETEAYNIEEKKVARWDDVWTEIVPLEDIYLSKIYERNVQKQGRMIWLTQIDWKDFKREFKSFDNAEYVYPGNRLSEDSLYFRLLGGTGVVTTDKVQILKYYDELNDQLKIIANGVWLNPIGGKKRAEVVAPMPFNHKMLPFVWSMGEPLDEKFAYGMSVPFKLKDPHKILNTQITMLVERELRAINPPILTSDIEAPKLIYGTDAVIGVSDVDAYKELQVSEASNSFFTSMNSIQGIISTHAQGGNSMVANSKQPKSAKEVLAQEQLKQLYLANALLLYYDQIRQEIPLVVKTALQFYKTKKYKSQDKRIIRSLMVPNSPLMSGGVGNLEVRFVKKKQDDMVSFFEALHKSITNGKMHEIIEVPLDVIDNLEFYIDEIKLEPEKTTEMQVAMFMENVVTPMMNIYVPAGIGDLGKLFLKHMQKLGVHPADLASDKVLPQIMAAWGDSYKIPDELMTALRGAGKTGNQTGNLMQSDRGIATGGTGNQGAPVFGSQGAKSMASSVQ